MMERCKIQTSNSYKITEILNSVQAKFSDPRLNLKSNLFLHDNKSFYIIEISHDLNDKDIIQECKSYIDAIQNE
jgi:hypothetical protein